MSTGADAMGVAAWLTPALIVAVLAALAHPAVGQPADSAPLAAADPAELIDPDCDPAEAEKADPLLVEEPDGICPPEKPAEGGDGGPAERPGDGGPADGERPADGPASGPERSGDGPQADPQSASGPPSGASSDPGLSLDLTLRQPTEAAPKAAPGARPAPAGRSPVGPSPAGRRSPGGRPPRRPPA